MPLARPDQVGWVVEYGREVRVIAGLLEAPRRLRYAPAGRTCFEGYSKFSCDGPRCSRVAEQVYDGSGSIHRGRVGRELEPPGCQIHRVLLL